MMRIVVTGSLGFIGSNLIENLISDKRVIEIIGLDNNFTANHQNIIYNDKVKYIFGNTEDIDKILKNVKINVLFHLGEYSRIVPSFEDIDIVHKFNSVGSFRVIKFCSDNNIKLVYAASSSKFGDEGNENLSPYAWMKAKNIELIKNFSEWYGLKYSIAYFYNVYGNRQIMEGKYSAVIGRFKSQYLSNKNLTVVSPGNQKRDFTNVKDIVRGLNKLITLGEGEEFQFGTGKNYTMLEIAQAFDHPIEIVPERHGERFSGIADKDESTKKIGWRAEIDIIDYIKTFVKLNPHEYKQ